MSARCRLGAAFVAILLMPLALAQRFDAMRPPAAQPPAEAVGVDASRLAILSMEGPEGHRYRIQVVAIGPPPAGGYPVLYLLDGNAAMAALTAADHASPLRGGVLLVAVGYDTDAYFDATARALDYTPPRRDGQPALDPRVPGRRGGGADAFLDFVQQRLMPRVAAAWPVDPQRQGIWGHSYGGLLALHALYTRPGLFAFHAAASPALGWQAPLMDEEADAFVAGAPRAKTRLLLMAGGAEQRRDAPSTPAAPMPAQSLAGRLRGVPGLRVEWRLFTGLSHGEAFSASLGPAIRAFLDEPGDGPG